MGGVKIICVLAIFYRTRKQMICNLFGLGGCPPTQKCNKIIGPYTAAHTMGRGVGHNPTIIVTSAIYAALSM